jgi:tetratricopeptide (TPR) repeat protein
LTWESSVALIDRSIPVTVSTVETTSAHLQAIVGYDSFLQQFLIRDPYLPSLQKNWAPDFLEYYAAFGPRAMVLVPLEQSSLLENLDLPDDSLYDALYQLETAIRDHQREKAVEICQTFAQLAPNHRLNYFAQRAIAIYDGDSTRILEINDLLLTLFPNHEIFLHEKLSCLQELARKEDRLKLLQSICDRPQTHPTFWQTYAEELGSNTRTIDQAKTLLRRSIQCAPEASESYASLADLLWSQQAFQEAFELYRFATCLSTTHPRYARSYFLAARHFNQTDAALKFLEERWRRLGQKSSEPTVTLFWALDHLDRTPQAFKLLHQACNLRPEDGELQLSAVYHYASYGQFTPAITRLKQAQGKVSQADWLKAAANLAQTQGNL